MPKPGETAQVKVIARFADGQTRDVTKEATVESNTPDVAKVDACVEGHGRAHRRSDAAWFDIRASSPPYPSRF